MEIKEILHILRHKRHDWMNQIQLLQGYASMDKMERVKEQLYQIIEQSEHERRLLNSGAENFTLWLLTFNWSHSHYQLTYLLDGDVDLSSHDDQLTAYAEKVITVLNEHSSSDELYEGFIHFLKTKEKFEINWSWTGEFKDTADLADKLTNDEGMTVFVDHHHELKINCKLE
ncbi:Spo0B domain-containing protein [Halobacillus sp. B23F22_1]|uniref:Spo0B domain-containing protein n=1 Tax=Halobacillus sp. B23F22_1 TaxID=3459514 RepID=UPI00373E4B0A